MSTGATTNWDIPLFGDGDAVTPIQAPLNGQSNALETALDTIQANAYTRYATLAALQLVTTGSLTRQHAVVYADPIAANNGDYYWSGSAWLQIPTSGLVPIIPTSAVGATVSALGKVTFSAASTVSVNGAFTGAYDNYRIVLDIPTCSTACNIGLVLRGSGADATSANYDLEVLSGVGTTASSSQALANTSAVVQAQSATIHFAEISLVRPFLATPTIGLAQSTSVQNPMTTGALALRSFSHRLSTSYDGITIIPSTGTITGTARIYGYFNG